MTDACDPEAARVCLCVFVAVRQCSHAAKLQATLPRYLNAAFGTGAWALLIGQQTDWAAHGWAPTRVWNALARVAHELYPAAATFVFHDARLVPDATRVGEDYVAAHARCAAGEWPVVPLHRVGCCRGVFAVPAADFFGVGGFPNGLLGEYVSAALARFLVHARFADDAPRAAFVRDVVMARPLHGNMQYVRTRRHRSAAPAPAPAPALQPAPAPCPDDVETALAGKVSSAGDGVRELVFHVVRKLRVMSAANVYVLLLQVHVSLPRGWTTRVATGSGRPYFVDSEGWSQWAVPLSSQ
jgi:hypothetical protein